MPGKRVHSGHVILFCLNFFAAQRRECRTMSKRIESRGANIVIQRGCRFVPVILLIMASAVLALAHVMPVHAQDEGDLIIALPGKLSAAQDEDFSYFFAAGDGSTYGAVGETPDVEEELATFAGRVSSPTVKLWGSLGKPAADGTPVIVVSSVLGPDYRPTAAPATPAPPIALITSPANVRSGPGTLYPVIGGLAVGEQCFVNSRSSVLDWFELACSAVTGWVFNELYTISGSTAEVPLVQVSPPPPATATPVPAPTPLPAPPQAQNGEWLAAYYGNTNLAEPSLLTRVEGRSSNQWPLNYEWSLDSPVPGTVPTDNWSARWTGRFYFEPGDYRCLARGAAGVRVYLDGYRVIDAWPNSEDTVSNMFNGVGEGWHEVRVEHFKQGGLAWVRAWWQKDNRGSSGGDYEHRDE